MQGISKDLIEHLAEKGLTAGEIRAYLQGLHDGMQSIKVNIEKSKREVGPDETDPLYAHTWNNIIEATITLTDKIVQSTFSGLEGEIEIGELE